MDLPLDVRLTHVQKIGSASINPGKGQLPKLACATRPDLAVNLVRAALAPDLRVTTGKHRERLALLVPAEVAFADAGLFQ